MTVKKWEDIDGWFDFESAYLDAINHFPNGSTFVEVGCFRGRSLCCLGQRAKEFNKSFRIVGVDHCRGSGKENGNDNHALALLEGEGTLAGILHRNIIDCGLEGSVDLLIAPSVRAASYFPDKSLQLVFLDASHDYFSLVEDISSWAPKVAPGGWLGGDDLSPVWPGVERVVRWHFGDTFKTWSHDSWRVQFVD